jgi:hypothetical protein
VLALAFEEDGGEADDRVERGAEFVAHAGEELALGLVGFLGGVLGAPELLLALLEALLGGARAGVLVVRLLPFPPEPLGDRVEGFRHAAQLVPRVERDLVRGVFPQHALGRLLEARHGPHDRRVEADPQIAHQPQQHRRGRPGDAAAALVERDPVAHEEVELGGRPLPEVVDRVERAGGRRRQGLGREDGRGRVDEVAAEDVDVLPDLRDGLVVRPLEAGADGGGRVVVEGALGAGAGVLERGAEQAREDEQPGALLRRDRLARGDGAAAQAGVEQEVVDLRQLQEDGVHEVVGVQVGIEDEVGGVAHVGIEAADPGDELRVSRVGAVPLQGRRLLAEGGDAGGGIEDGPFLAVHRLDRSEVVVDPGEGALELGAVDAPVPGHQAGVSGVPEEGHEGAEIAGAFELHLGEGDAVAELGQQEGEGHRQGRGEAEADEEELLGIGQPIHDRDGRPQQSGGGARIHGSSLSMTA